MSNVTCAKFNTSFNLDSVVTSYDALCGMLKDVAGQFELPYHKGEVVSKFGNTELGIIYLTYDVGTGALKLEYIHDGRKVEVRAHGDDSEEAREFLKVGIQSILMRV